MTRAAEKDIRSALRQLRGSQGRIRMLRTMPGSYLEQALVTSALRATFDAERDLLALLSAEGTKR